MNSTSSQKLIVVAALVIIAGSALAGCLGANPGGGNANVKTSCGGSGGGNNTAMALGPTTFAAPEVTQVPIADALRQVMDQTNPFTLKIGTLMPMTGVLAAYGQDMQRGAELARDQINDVTGGGLTVEIIHEDSKTDANQAPAAFDRLKAAGVTAIVGAASSGVTASILDRAKNEKVIVITPASTSPELTTRDNGGYFFRVPPSDALQGKVLAELVHSEGCRSVSILAVNNAYGQGLGSVFESSFKGKGGTVAQKVFYQPTDTTFTSFVQQAGQGNPDAIVLIGYPGEGSQVMKEAYQTGAMSRSVFFFSEGLYDPKFVELAPKEGDTSVLAGLQGTTPKGMANNVTQAFIDAFQAKHNKQPGLFAAESYDAVWAVALAAAYAGNANAEQVKNHMLTVYNTPGQNVTGTSTNPNGLTLALAKQDINYQGASGDFNWDNKGDPTSGTYAYWKVGNDGALTVTREGISPDA